MSPEDTMTSLEDAVGMPIDLNSIDKSLLLFYLAGKTPLSVADFAESCMNKSSTVGYILRTRFESETEIDMNNTLRLSAGIRRSIIRGGEPLIKAGHEQLGRGKSHSSKENYTEAADCFAQAVSDFQCVIERYGAIDYESKKLEDLIATAKTRHDAAAVKAAKKSINSHAVNATEYGQQGEKHADDQPSRAADNYQKAANQLSQALEVAKEYNQSALKHDSTLSIAPIRQKLAEVSERLNSLEEISPTTSTEASDNDDAAAAEEETQSDPSDRNLIDNLQRLAAQLGESPQPEFAGKYGEYPANAYTESFESWEDALTAADLDPIDETVRNRRTYSRTELLDAVSDLVEELGHTPSRTEMNRKGVVSSVTVMNRFRDWSTALSLAKARGTANSAKQRDVAEKQDHHEDTTQSDGDIADPKHNTEDTGERTRSQPDEQSGIDSSDASTDTAAGSTDDRGKLIEAIKTVHTRLGRVPKASEVAEEVGIIPNDFSQEFGDWPGALEAAGIDLQQALADDIGRVTQEVGEIPTTADLDESGIFSSGFYTSYFGSWDAVLEQAKRRQESSAGPSRAEMLEIIQTVHERVGRAPKATELPEDCGFSQYDFYNEFGSWDEALETAGIDRKQSMINEIERVAEKLGQVPSTVDMQEYSAYTSYSKYFDSWDSALEQADIAEYLDHVHSRNAMLGVIRDLESQTGRIPKPTEIPDGCEYSPNDFYTEFGGWNEALKTAGLDKEQAMIDEIERVAEKLGQVPNSTDMKEHGVYSSYSGQFGSWNNALEQADTAEYLDSVHGRDAMLEAIRDVENQIERIPKPTEIPDECEYSPNDFYTEFGGWDEALEAAGLDKEQALLDDIERVAEELGRAPSLTDMDEQGEYVRNTYSTCFDSWDRAIEKSNVNENNKQRLIEKLQSLEKRLGRLPKTTDLHDISELSQHDYVETFGSWSEALEAANISRKQYFTDDLNRVATEIGGRPGTTDVTRLGDYPASMYQAYFGSWEKALEAAGITPTANALGVDRQKQESSKDDASLVSVPIETVTSDITQVKPQVLADLKTAGYTTLEDVSDVDAADLMEIRGIGPVTANNIIQIAERNLSNEVNQSGEVSSSNDSNSSSQFSTSKPHTDQASTQSQGAKSDQIQPNALETTWESINGDERIDGQFLIQILSIDRSSRGEGSVQLDVQDQNRRSFEMNIRSKDNIDQNWTEGCWYVIEEARGIVWESSGETTRKQLSSTEDLVITDLGEDFVPSTTQTRGQADTASESAHTDTTHKDDTTKDTSGSATSSQDTEVSADETEPEESDGTEPDNDGILGEIASDFDDL